jgi:hypothetical protein
MYLEHVEYILHGAPLLPEGEERVQGEEEDGEEGQGEGEEGCVAAEVVRVTCCQCDVLSW